MSCILTNADVTGGTVDRVWLMNCVLRKCHITHCTSKVPVEPMPIIMDVVINNANITLSCITQCLLEECERHNSVI